MTYKDLQIGSTLPNGSSVMAYCVIGTQAVVCCSKLKANNEVEFVTWTMSNNDLASTSNGHYFDTGSESLTDFKQRVSGTYPVFPPEPTN